MPLTHFWQYSPLITLKAPFWCFQGVSSGSIGQKWVNTQAETVALIGISIL